MPHATAGSDPVRVESLSPHAVPAWLDAVADLRIRVFRDFPYLYDGSPNYEATYLRRYAESDRALLVIARVGDRVVGASTALPLADELPELRRPFEDAGIDPARWFYFGESVLLPEWRGRGIGHRFFDARESRARALGLAATTFCAVDRPPDHPRRPAEYRPLDPFWTARGYTRRDDLRTTLAWRDLDEPDDRPKPMTFWTRELDPG